MTSDVHNLQENVLKWRWLVLTSMFLEVLIDGSPLAHLAKGKIFLVIHDICNPLPRYTNGNRPRNWKFSTDFKLMYRGRKSNPLKCRVSCRKYWYIAIFWNTVLTTFRHLQAKRSYVYFCSFELSTKNCLLAEELFFLFISF